MSVDIVTVGFCAQYYSTWTVRGSRGDTYVVTLNGAEQQPHCTCYAFAYAPADAKDCKHLRLVWEHGCLWNPQWKDAGPNDYARYGVVMTAHDMRVIPGGECPGCGGPVVPVRIGV